MALDNIQIKEVETNIKRNESLSANSIKFRQESLRSLMNARDAAIKNLEKVVADAVEENVSEEEIQETIAKDYALVIAKLEQDINILEGMQGPVELVQSRAIRLVDKMIKAARENSKGIYAELDKKAVVEPIAVENISTEAVSDSVENAINNEESLNDEDIKDLFDKELGLDKDEIEQKINERINEYLAANPVVEEEKKNDEVIEVVPTPEVKDDVVVEMPIPRDRLPQETEDEYINYLTEFYSGGAKKDEVPEIKEESQEEVEEYEYVPMTDEEVAASREALKMEEYEQAQKDYRAKEYAVDFKNRLAGITLAETPIAQVEDEVVRDNIEIVPEREEKSYAKEETTAEVEPRRAVASIDFIEKLKGLSQEELDAQVSELTSYAEKLEAEANTVKASVEEEKRINSEVVAEEEEVLKKDAEIAEEEARKEKERAELEAEEAKAKEELRETTIETLRRLKEKTMSLSSEIQSDKEELASVNKDTETRRGNISSANRSIETRRENISNITSASEGLKESISKTFSKRDEISMMFPGEETAEDPIQKVM